MGQKLTGRDRRRRRIRKKVRGTSERPRLTVFRSNKHIYAQVVDDDTGKTLAHAGSQSSSDGNKSDAAKRVGAAIASACQANGIGAVVFDRNGYIYHGRVQALADAAREAGLRF